MNRVISLLRCQVGVAIGERTGRPCARAACSLAPDVSHRESRPPVGERAAGAVRPKPYFSKVIERVRVKSSALSR